MVIPMFTINQTSIFQQTIKKSTFISVLAPAESKMNAEAILDGLRKQYPDATHYCYAYITGKSGETYRFSDDGEPSQTAGSVIYSVLQKNNLTNIICVVIRYYGGIKLGAGGLVRAYKSSTSQNISQANTIPLIEMCKITLIFDYPYEKQITYLMQAFDKVTIDYLDQIKVIYKIPLKDVPILIENLNNLTKSQISIEVG